MSRDLYRFSCAMNGSVTEAGRDACLQDGCGKVTPGEDGCLYVSVACDDPYEAEVQARELFAAWLRESLKRAMGTVAVDIDWGMGTAQELPAAVCIPEHIAAEGLSGASEYLSCISGRDAAGFTLRRWDDDGRMAVSHEKREGMVSVCLSSYPNVYLPGWVLVPEDIEPGSEETLDYIYEHFDRIHFGRPELDFRGVDIDVSE